MTLPQEQPFPTQAILPKDETQSSSFLKSNPGVENTLIGILDTGIDPCASGMQLLPSGDPKLINVIDCTGCNDVDVSFETDAVLKDGADGDAFWEVSGLSGRILRLPSEWNICPFPDSKIEADEQKEEIDDVITEGTDTINTTANLEESSTPTTKKVRVGILQAYTILSSPAISRLKQSRSRTFLEHQTSHLTRIRSELEGLKKSKSTHETISKRKSLTFLLQLLGKTEIPDDPGPLYDCLVYHDGTTYQAALFPVSHDPVCRSMESFSSSHSTQRMSPIDQSNYTFNFYNAGKILSVITTQSSHGTHVGSIAAKYDHPDDRTNGVSPHSKLLSLKIGDGRVSQMETGTGLVRALMQSISHKCDVINLSFGEGVTACNSGFFVTMTDELVRKYGISFVSSAGNDGPGLSSVTAPGPTTDLILAVGAYVSREMMRVEYSMALEEKTNEGAMNGTTYTWSSVGPAPDGSLGVDVLSPGGAITSVPNWTLQKSQLMNGTSMASPNATGCVALLISACKQENISTCPNRIMRAILNTAQKVDGLSDLEQGFGMIYVERAWEYLKEGKDDWIEDLYFQVHISSSSLKPRGIYLRDPISSNTKQTHSVHVSPKFPPRDYSPLTQERRLSLELQIRLVSTAPDWLRAPEFFVCMHNGRSFDVEIDPTGLKYGVHTAKVFGYEDGKGERGALFYVPVTVIRSREVEGCEVSLGQIQFQPAQVKRNFFVPPQGAVWMDVRIRDCRTVSTESNNDKNRVTMVLHVIQLPPHSIFTETKKYLAFLPGQEKLISVPLQSDTTFELALARYWSSIKGDPDVAMDVRATFRGVTPTPTELFLKTGDKFTQLRLNSHVTDEIVSPTAELSVWRTPLLPKTPGGVLSVLTQDERDLLPSDLEGISSLSKPTHQLLLEYQFLQPAKGSFLPVVPVLQEYLYESELESQLIFAFDADKRLLGCCDYKSCHEDIVVPRKTTVTLRMQIRSDDPTLLKRLGGSVVIWIERKLEKKIALGVYPSYRSYMKDEKMKEKTLKQGQDCAVMVAEPPSSALPKGVKAGDVLEGKVWYVASPKGVSVKSGGFAVRHTVSAIVPEEKKDEVPSLPDDDRGEAEKMSEALRDFKVERLGKTAGNVTAEKEEEFCRMLDSMMDEYKDHLPVGMISLRFHDGEKRREDGLDRVVMEANKIMGAIDESEMAMHFGTNCDVEDPQSCQKRKEMKETKAFFVEALARKTRALMDLENKQIAIPITKANSDSNHEDEDEEKCTFSKSFKQLQKWVDNLDQDLKYAVISLEKERRADNFGLVLQLLNKLMEQGDSGGDGATPEDNICSINRLGAMKRMVEVFEHLGFTHWKEHWEVVSVVAAPKEYALF